MPQRKHKSEEIVAKLRQVDVLLSQGRPVAEAIRTISYNTLGPHSSLGYKPPAPHAVLWPGKPPPSNMAMKPTMH